MKHLSTISLLCAMCISAQAKDLKVDIDLSHDLWWNAPEVPTVKFTLADTLGNANKSQVTFRVTSDRDENHDLMKFVAFANMRAGNTQDMEYELRFAEPGFYKCFIEDDGNVIEKFNIGYEPTLVYSLPDAQPDFDQFWQKALADLAACPGNYIVTENAKMSGKKRKAYDVTMTGVDNEPVKGLLFVPVAEGKYPALVYFNGYGAKPWDMHADSRDDIIEFMTSVRGQFFSQPDNHYGDWIRYHLDDPNTYYYRGAFLDAVRAIDFLSQYPSVDTDNIFAEGGSQGGALTLAAAALDHRLNAVMAYIPFLSDYPDYFRIVPWPASAVKEEAARLEMTDEEMYRNLSYFDIKNLARNIQCPVLMGIGLQDPTCPPHTNMASYTLITAPKQLKIYPTLGHTVDYSDWNPRRDEFMRQHMK